MGFKAVGKDEPTTGAAVGTRPAYRFDLLPPHALAAAAEIRAEAAERYGDDVVDSYVEAGPLPHLNKALVHAYAYLAGDTSEKGGDPREHLRHALVRMMMAVEAMETAPREPYVFTTEEAECDGPRAVFDASIPRGEVRIKNVKVDREAFMRP